MLDSKVLTFLEVAAQGSYTRAAENLHLTQPAVTQQIHRLEEHYGQRLVDTCGRAVRLTEAGEKLERHARGAGGRAAGAGGWICPPLRARWSWAASGFSRRPWPPPTP